MSQALSALPGETAWGAPLRREPPPAELSRVEVAVIGGGLAGLSAALELTRRGRAPVVFEAAGLGAGASGRSTGMLTPGVGQDLPGQRRRFGEEGARALYELSLDAVRSAAALIEAEGIACDLDLGGQLIVARGPSGRRRLRRFADALLGLELPGELLDDAALAARIQLAPAALAPGEGPAALRLPVAGTLDPIRLVAGLAERIERLGGTIYTDAPVADLGAGWLEVAGRRIEAEQVVLAAPALAARRLQRGRLLPVTLEALVSEPLDAAARERLGWASREGVIDTRRLFDYFRLTGDRIVFGGGRPGYGWAGAEAPAAGELEARYRATFPAGLAPPVARRWSGRIGCTLDNLPAIGPLPGLPGVLHLGGWCGHGIALSLAAGRWAAAHLAGEGLPAGPLFRGRPPLLPGEVVRWLGFRGVVSFMAWRDRC